MRTDAGTNPPLRLVGEKSPVPVAGLTLDATPKRPLRGRVERARASRAIASENAQAAKASREIAEGDARWVFAAKVGQTLQGGRLAALPADRRQKLIRLATKMGLRAFDANLVIAIVQDAVRTGKQAPGHGPSDGVTGRLAMIRTPEQSGPGAGGTEATSQPPLWLLIALSGGVAILSATMLLGWLLGA